MSDDDEFRRVAEIERAANGKASYLDMDAGFCARSVSPHAGNSKPQLRTDRGLAASLLLAERYGPLAGKG